VISVTSVANSVTGYDVIVVGGGPAGACAAVRLAEAGARVLVVERERFPRAKLCGEFVSPECFAHFERLGVAESMAEAGGARVFETKFYAASGRGVAVPSEWLGAGAGARFALGLSRAEMDARLLRRARAAGAEVLEGAQCVGVLWRDGRVCGVRLAAGGSERVCESAVTVDATGRARVVSRRAEKFLRGAGNAGGDASSGRKGTGEAASDTASNASSDTRSYLSSDAPGDVSSDAMGDVTSRARSGATSNAKGGARGGAGRRRLVAFKAHLEGARGASGACEIYFYRGGYGGLSRVEGGLSNLCFIVAARDVRALESDPERVVREVLAGNRRAAETLRDARAATPWLAVALEGFGRFAPAPAPGLLSAGDAASFIDPFTGSGMLMAFESGELAAAVLARRLDGLRRACASGGAAPGGGPFAALAEEYRALYRERFDARLRVCSALRRAAFAPAWAAEAAVRALGASEALRRLLARATRSGRPT
jgi:menaquinone-9 beta-reductase